MIRDTTIDEALIEIMRTKKALEALRKARKSSSSADCFGLPYLNGWDVRDQATQHSAAKRASMDLTRVLSRLRGGK